MHATTVTDASVVSNKTHPRRPSVRLNAGMTRLGELLRLYRAVHGLGVREVAAEIGIHYATLSRFERTDTGMTAEHLMKLLAWLLAAHKQPTDSLK